MSEALKGLPLWGLRIAAEANGQGEKPLGWAAELMVIIKAPGPDEARSRAAALLLDRTEWRRAEFLEVGPVRSRALLPPAVMPAMEAADRSGFAVVVFPRPARGSADA